MVVCFWTKYYFTDLAWQGLFRDNNTAIVPGTTEPISWISVGLLPENLRRSLNVRLMLAHRLRCWSKTNPTLDERRLVLAGLLIERSGCQYTTMTVETLGPWRCVRLCPCMPSVIHPYSYKSFVSQPWVIRKSLVTNSWVIHNLVSAYSAHVGDHKKQITWQVKPKGLNIPAEYRSG